MKIGYINVFVSDLERSVRFFTEALGFRVKQVEKTIRLCRI